MSKKLDLAFDRFYEHARREQLDIVRKIMNNNEWITEFCNAMGASFFTEILYPNLPEEQEEFVDSEDERISEFTDFMDRWDNTLKFSGDSIMIIKDNFDNELVETFSW